MKAVISFYLLVAGLTCSCVCMCVYVCVFHLVDGPSAEGGDQPHLWRGSGAQEETHHLL